MAKVAFTTQAISDLEEIATYIALDSAHYASLQVSKLYTRAIALEEHPNIGRVVPELNLRSVREVIEGNYRIIYKLLNKDTIHILTVHHSRRQLNSTELRKMSRSLK